MIALFGNEKFANFYPMKFLLKIDWIFVYF